jgi:hypothetical protein
VKTRIHTLLAITAAFAGLTMTAVSEPEAPSPESEGKKAPAVSITISEPGFEADGNWKLAHTGASVAGLFMNDILPNYIKAGLWTRCLT